MAAVNAIILITFPADGAGPVVATYNTSDFRKGLKVQIDGEPYLMVEMNFVKPGKGNALYKCRMRNLVRGTMLDRTYKAAIRSKVLTWKPRMCNSCIAKAKITCSWTPKPSSNTK